MVKFYPVPCRRPRKPYVRGPLRLASICYPRYPLVETKSKYEEHCKTVKRVSDE